MSNSRKGVVILVDQDDLTELPGVFYEGGLTVMKVHATVFPTTFNLQVLGADGTTWVTASANITANGLTILTLAPGKYRMIMTTGTMTNGHVNLDPVPN